MNKITKKITGIVLAGGKGTRLKPLTDTIDKPLLNVGGKPMILYAIDKLVTAGITDLVIVIQSRNADMYFNLLKDGQHLGATSVTYIWHPEVSMGMPSAIGLVKHLINPEDSIAVVCADVLIENTLIEITQSFIKQQGGARILVSKMDDTAGFSLLETTGDTVTKIYDKDKDRHQSGLIDLGTGLYSYDVFSKIESLYPSEKEVGIWELNKLYLHESSLQFTEIQGWWSDAGKSIAEYNEVNKRYEKNS